MESISLKKVNLESQNIDELKALGKKLGELIEPSTLIILSGELGAGKTTFTGAIAEGMEVECSITSPTFQFLKRYSSGRIPLDHMDVYRIEAAPQLVDIGFWDLLSKVEPGALIVEWGEKFNSVVSASDLVVRICVADADTRDIEIMSHSEKGNELLEALCKDFACS